MTDGIVENKKRFYVIILGLIVLGAFIWWVNKSISPDVISELKQTKAELNETKQELNQTKQIVNVTSKTVNETKVAVLNISDNQETSFKNQKVIAQGLNQLGNVVIGKINNISDKTKLIDDIKFDTEQILNKTELKNITLP